MGERRYDLVVVGGGIAGGAFAAVMARAGAEVLVLERQSGYRDRVRGELLWPWGVKELQRLGLDDVLLGAGANVADRMETHDELEDPEAAGTLQDLSAPVEGVPGSLNLHHPVGTQALVDAASGHGARVLTGIDGLEIETGVAPAVSWTDADGEHRVACGLIVGADGRNSAVRRQAGIELHADPPAHLAAGLLVDDLAGDGRTNVAARAGDLMFLSFPQKDGRARLYHCMPTEQRTRFAGRDAANVFLRAVGDVSRLPDPERWVGATPAGPCATFTCEDSWVDAPFGRGVVLIGDAGGYNNPLIGQGLSLGLRDARVLSEQLLGQGGTTAERLEAYGHERTERLRRARIACLLVVWIHGGFQRQAPDVRPALRERTLQDELLTALLESHWRGFEILPRTPGDDEVRERLYLSDPRAPAPDDVG